jgi:protocatechuate 3,4-dioxygenase beta subunit
MDARPSTFGPGGPGSVATTDENGRYSFKDLDAGRYSISAQRTGYVVGFYGTRSTNAGQRRGSMRGGTPLNLASGQELKSIDIKLYKQGIIAGRVIDEDGEPLQNANVQVMRRTYQRGRETWMPMNGGQVNDLGEYRIANLPPGKYILSLNPHRWGPMQGPPASPPAGTPEKPFDEGYVSTYYPEARDPAQATPIEIDSGQEVTGIDFRARKGRTYRVRGTVLEPNGTPAKNVFINAFPGEGGMMFGPRGGTNVRGNDGKFELTGLAPGSYTLMANRMGGGGEGRMQHLQSLTVGEEHVNNFVVQLSEPVAIKGVVTIELKDKPAPDLGNMRVVLENDSAMMPLVFGSGNAVVKERSFELTNVSPGKFRVSAMGLPDGYYIRSVRAGNQELPNRSLDLRSGAAGPMEIVLSDKAGTISGTVNDAEGKPTSGISVVLMPSDPAQRVGFDAYKTTNSDQSGAFTWKNLPPGEYVAYAFADTEDGAYQDPAWLKNYENAGTKVNLKESGAETITLKVLQ